MSIDRSQRNYRDMDNNASKFDAFPRDIMVEILSRVPVESLFRLKSLNKYWYFFIRCLIKDPGFVSKHLRHSESSPAILLVCKHERGLFDPPEKSSTGQTEGLLDKLVTSACIVSFSTDDKEEGELQCVTKDLNLPCCISELVSETIDVYCCNGIVCLPGDSASAITLYNPALCEFETFHPSTNLLDEGNVIVTGIGFGCDTTGSVYKVVRFFEPMKAEVFVLGETSGSWREIDISIKVNEIDNASDVYLKGNCFWSCEELSTVICFDVGGEAFHEIPFPDEARDLWFCSLGRCKDSICVMWESGHGIEHLEVWTLDVSCCQSGCSYSWKKLLTTESFLSALDLWTFWDVDRGEIFADNHDGVIKSYNLFNGTERSLPFGLSSDKVHLVYYLDHFIESLVSIKSLNKARST